LNDGWKFKRQAAPGAAQEPEFINAERPGYADSSWSNVFLPHTWDVTPDNPFTVPHHFRGIGWYRRALNVPDEWKGRRVSVDFKGVFQIADVWINGKHAGQHVGGYTGFQFDITDYLNWGSNNLLAVRVNDVLNPDIAPANETNVPGYGGIYRSVSLVVTNPVHVAPNGAWVTTEQSGNSVVVHVHTPLKNSDSSPHTVQIHSGITDAQHNAVASSDSSITLSGGEEKEIVQTFQPLTGAHLWSPQDPYLYQLVTTLEANGSTVDNVATPFGIRFMSNDAVHGFALNGKPINLHGANRRQDYGFLGDAVPEAIGERDIRIIKDMGANFIRTSHYPQDPAVLAACDRLGILVWEEVPNIKIYLYPPSGDETKPTETERFPRAYITSVKRQIREMIDRDRNHPSIIIWGFADDLSLYHYPEDFTELTNFTHSLDNTRWTAGRVPPNVTDIVDATAIPELVKHHSGHPEGKYIWNEWGAFASERGREGAPFYKSLPADPGSNVSMSDSDAALLLEGYSMQWMAMPWLGTVKWCMFDTGELNAVQTQSLWTRHRDDKVTLRWPFNDYYGLADMWRLPKEGYYLLQSQWTEKPMVHIVGHWMPPTKPGAKRTVRVYSNADTVELVLNGRSLGVHRSASAERVWHDFHAFFDQFQTPEEFSNPLLPGAKLEHGPFIWDDVPYEPGTLVAIAKNANATVRDERRTPGAPARVLLKTEKDTLAGEDVSFIEADVVDSAGTIVPDARPWIHFDIKGPGRILGGVADIDAITGIAAINVQPNAGTGEITVTASSPGLEPSSVRIRSVEAKITADNR
jgi:beta-galactosidase